MNIVFGFVGGLLTAMVVVWGFNGFFQSMGWGPTVKAMANWFPSGKRSRTSGR
jgi:OPA family glycerol-3-phosphate transporter-like MFS transporter